MSGEPTMPSPLRSALPAVPHWLSRIAMSSAFNPFPAGAQAGPLPRRKVEYSTGLVASADGAIVTTQATSVLTFTLFLVPVALGIGFGHPTISTLVSRAARSDEQGRVQGAAGAMESLGRAIGPVWGNAALGRFGDAVPYLSAAACLLLTFALSVTMRLPETEPTVF